MKPIIKLLCLTLNLSLFNDIVFAEQERTVLTKKETCDLLDRSMNSSFVELTFKCNKRYPQEIIEESIAARIPKDFTVEDAKKCKACSLFGEGDSLNITIVRNEKNQDETVVHIIAGLANYDKRKKNFEESKLSKESALRPKTRVLSAQEIYDYYHLEHQAQ